MMSRSRNLARASKDLTLLLANGHLVYTSAAQIIALRDDVRAWIADLGVEVSFSPDTPPELRDYFLSATLGAVEGAFKGALLGLVLGALLNAPGTGIAIGAGIGGAVGAVGGVQAVASGHRVRIRAWWSVDGAAVALVECL